MIPPQSRIGPGLTFTTTQHASGDTAITLRGYCIADGKFVGPVARCLSSRLTEVIEHNQEPFRVEGDWVYVDGLTMLLDPWRDSTLFFDLGIKL